MRILVGCEFSGIVRDAFNRQGHEAISVDLLDSERSGPHIVGDIREVIDQGWDMLIAFPPCTHLCVSGARWFKDKVEEQKQAIEFVEYLWQSDIPLICIENPVGILSTKSILGKPTQIIQPYEYGHEETKKTCLWLKGLPKLIPTDIRAVRNRNLTKSGQNKLSPSPTRWRERSRTYTGIAEAMAQQWARPHYLIH